MFVVLGIFLLLHLLFFLVGKVVVGSLFIYLYIKNKNVIEYLFWWLLSFFWCMYVWVLLIPYVQC